MFEHLELWLPIEGWEEYYEISDLGQVRSLERTIITKDNKKVTRKQKLLIANPNSTGYKAFALSQVDRGHSTRYVHIEVLKAFVGKCPKGMIASHLGDKLDNRLSQLCYRTLPEAQRLHTEKKTRTRVTDTQVLTMRIMYHNGMSIAEIARKCSLEYRHAFNLVKGKTRQMTQDYADRVLKKKV